MDKIAVKNYALWARKKLVEQAAQKAYKAGIYSDSLVEEAACHWFIMIIALRYMEVNGCLPVKGRPLDLCDKQHLIILCRKLHNMLPFIFGKINNHMELLFPDSLLGEEPVIRKLVLDIDEEDFKEVEILGWLYQFFISEKKDEVFAALKRNVKISKEDIPAATQLFTPKWIAKYLAENSIGRLYLEGHDSRELREKWKYFQKEDRNEEVFVSLYKKIGEERKNIKPEDIRILDPACGSGNMLVYAFEVLYDIYLNEGYIKDDIPKLIIKNNLYGLDIDDRAANIASLSIIMKAREKNQRILEQMETEGIDINIVSIKETNCIMDKMDMVIKSFPDKEYARTQVKELFDTFFDAREYGSIIQVNRIDMDFWQGILKNLGSSEEEARHLRELLLGLVKQAKIMSGKYNVVITNPPYMGSNSMNSKLAGYISRNYNNSKADLYGVFIEKCLDYTKSGFYTAMITQQSWMFLSSFKNMREKLLGSNTIISALHLGSRAFEEISGEVVQTVSFVIFRGGIEKFRPIFRRLTDYNCPQAKEEAYLSGKGIYSSISQEEFFKIPGLPIVYWISTRGAKVFQEGIPLGDMGEPRQGLATADNERFLRLWHEVDINSIGFGCGSGEEFLLCGKRWVPFIKGGLYRKWYGNQEYVVDWEKNGLKIKEYISERYPYLKGNYSFVVKNERKYFNEGITWTAVGGSNFSIRYFEKGFIFSNAGMAVFETKMPLQVLGALLNSRVSSYLLSCIRETFNFNQGDIARLPVIDCKKYYSEICSLFNENVSISKEDWDSFETSWNFETHPLIKHRMGSSSIEEAFNNWEKHREKQFRKLKANEEKLNKIFIDIYGLKEELAYEVQDTHVTVSKADLARDIKSFISYGVGCIMGRYSLDQKGLVYGGGLFNAEKYISFKPCREGIVPILPGEYFCEDIVSKFVDFVKAVFGGERLSQNLEFIASVLDVRKGDLPSNTIKKYFLQDFYKDHLKVYKRRPIYWLFTSGKDKGFNALVYMHRLNKDTLERLRTEYLDKLQKKLEDKKAGMVSLLSREGLTQKARKSAEMKMGVIISQLNEIENYDALLRYFTECKVEIDLNYGVKANYENFDQLLQKI